MSQDSFSVMEVYPIRMLIAVAALVAVSLIGIVL